MNKENQPSVDNTLQQYRILVKGHLHPHWSEWLENMTITQEADGTTSLSGPVTDQAALYGLINKLRDMGLTLLSVEVITAGIGQEGGSR